MACNVIFLVDIFIFNKGGNIDFQGRHQGTDFIMKVFCNPCPFNFLGLNNGFNQPARQEFPFRNVPDNG